MRELSDRVMAVMKHVGLTEPAFAKSMGISQELLSTILHNRLEQPCVLVLVRILHAYPKISGDWLLTGISEKDRNEETWW